MGSQPPPRNGGRRKATNSGSARALAASSSTKSERECELALADTLGRCGLLADDYGGRALMAITVSPDHLAAQGISHTVDTPTSSLIRKRTITCGIIDHLAKKRPLLGDIIQPYAARIMSAIRKSPSPLTAIMRPISTARYSLARATSICQRLHGHLRSIPSRRDALSSDDISSAAPQRQGAPQAAHAFAAAAAAKPLSIKGMRNAADARDDADITLAVHSGSTWHLYPHQDQLCNLRPCHDSIKGTGRASQRCFEMGDLSFLALDENGCKVTVELLDVRLAPNVDIALISASQLIGAGFEVILGTPPRLKSPP